MESYILTDDKVRANCITAVALAPLGKEVVIREKSKTSPQRRYWHAIITELSQFTGYTQDQMKWMIKKSVLGMERWTTEKGGEYAMVKSSEQLNIKEYSDLIDETRRIAAKIGCTLKPPIMYGIEL